MTITLSDDEYRRLLMLVLLGEWMMNATRKEPDASYEDTASKVYACARGTSAQDQVDFDEDGGNWVPSERFEADAHALIDEYDEVTFWEELTARMTERDLIATFGERAVHGMRPDQREREAKSIAHAYTLEFEEQGLNRLVVTP